MLGQVDFEGLRVGFVDGDVVLDGTSLCFIVGLDDIVGPPEGTLLGMALFDGSACGSMHTSECALNST